MRVAAVVSLELGLQLGPALAVAHEKFDVPGVLEGPLGQGRSAKPDATATPSAQPVSMSELHAVLRLLVSMGVSFALRLLVSADRFRTNFRDANLTRARTRRTPRASRTPGIEPRTAAPDLTQRMQSIVVAVDRNVRGDRGAMTRILSGFRIGAPA